MDTVAVLVPEDQELGLIVIQLAVTEAVHEADDVMFIVDDVAFGCDMAQLLQGDVVGAPMLGGGVAVPAGWLIVILLVPPEFFMSI